jgi:3-oxoacyl-[acyl-carrier protein] reductase
MAGLDWSRGMPWPPASVPQRLENIASIAGISAAPGIGFYGVSKAAHPPTTRLELAPGIRVNAVAPRRDQDAVPPRRLYEDAQTEVAAIILPPARPGAPEDVSGSSPSCSADAAWITGQTIVIDGAGLSVR